MFSILMAIANIGTGIGLAVTGLLVDSLDFPLTFALLAVFNLLVFPLIPVVFQKKSAGAVGVSDAGDLHLYLESESLFKRIRDYFTGHLT